MIQKNLKGVCLLVITLLAINHGNGQTYNSTNGAKANGMGGAVANVSDIWATQNNIAGIARVENPGVGMYYLNRFGVSGLNYYSATSVIPMKFGSFGISLDRTGTKSLNEQRLGIGYGHNIDNVSLGAKINLLQVSMQDVGTRMVVAMEFGGIADLTKELTFGAHIYNFNKAKAGDYQDERFSTVMKAAISYKPFDKLMLNLETEKNIEYDNDIKFGIEYQILDKVYFRSGFSMLTQSGGIGLGFNMDKFGIDYAINSHNSLGISNHFSINYFPKGSSKKE